jgi:hypothetical protein
MVSTISPFLYFKSSKEGHQTKLCFYKTKKGQEPNQKFIYEILGDSEETELDRSDFQSQLDELRYLLKGA